MLSACLDDFLGRIPQMTVEFHCFCGITAPAEVDACIDPLQPPGVEPVRFSRVGRGYS